MAGTPPTIKDMLGKMLLQMESTNAMLREWRQEREAERSAPRASGRGAEGTTRTAHTEPATEPVVEGSNEPHIPKDRATVVGMLSRIVEALKGFGLIHTEDSDEKKTSPLPRKRFGLNFNQAQRGNGMYFMFQIWLCPSHFNREL